MNSLTEKGLRESAYNCLISRAVYCDFLEDAGDERLGFWKWALLEELKPDPVPLPICPEGYVEWGNKHFSPITFYSEQNCYIPEELFLKLPRNNLLLDHIHPSIWWRGVNLEDAWLALESAWLDLNSKNSW